MSSTNRVRVGVLLSVVALLVACGNQPEANGPESASAEPAAQQGSLTTPTEDITVLDDEGMAERALASSHSFFTEAPVAVVADLGNEARTERAAAAAVALGAPLLPSGAEHSDELDDELERLGVQQALTFGPTELPESTEAITAPDDDGQLAQTIDRQLGETPDAEGVAAVAATQPGTLAAHESQDPEADSEPGADSEAAELIATVPPEAPESDMLVLSTGDVSDLPAAATARAAGAEVQPLPQGDPRATSESVAAFVDEEPEYVVALGSDFGDAETLAWRSQTAQTGTELPGGGQLTEPDKHYVALYGTPTSPELGVLGEQGLEDTIERAADHASDYDELFDDEVIPALEIIATVASAKAGEDGNYSSKAEVGELRPLIEAAREAGQYVVLDLQPGRDSFLSQAQRYEELLREPHVGLALDPEWNLGPNEEHLAQIGSVSAEEINEVVDWLADMTRQEALPQKFLLLHQFQAQMIPEVSEVDTSRSELAIVLHADGQGTQEDKQATWRMLHDKAGDTIDWWGWKNFYDEDSPMLSPEETVDLVDPAPQFISYQ